MSREVRVNTVDDLVDAVQDVLITHRTIKDVENSPPMDMTIVEEHVKKNIELSKHYLLNATDDFKAHLETVIKAGEDLLADIKYVRDTRKARDEARQRRAKKMS